MCAGYRYRNWRAMDVLQGVSIQYDAGYSVDGLGPSQTNSDKLHVSSFAGSAIWTRRGNGQKGSCFVVSKNDKRRIWVWCTDNHKKLCEALDSICNNWHWPSRSDGTPVCWAFRLDGWLFKDGEVKEICDRNREDRLGWRFVKFEALGGSAQP